MLLRHKSQSHTPNISAIKDNATRTAINDMIRLIYSAHKDIHDDLKSIAPEIVTVLPTAAKEYYQRFMIKNNTGAADTLHICIYDGAAGVYKWQQVTLS